MAEAEKHLPHKCKERKRGDREKKRGKGGMKGGRKCRKNE
jgi:hypothetical protein